MPEVQDREAAESKLRTALNAAWKQWTAVIDPAVLNTRDLLELLRQHTFQPLWEVYYRAQYAVAQDLGVVVSEQVLAAAFLLYYSQWATDVAARWMSRVSTWLLEARIAAHARRREQAPPATTQPNTSTATPPQSAVPPKQGGSTPTAPSQPSPVSPAPSTAPPTQAVPATQADTGAPVDMTPSTAKPVPDAPKVIDVPGATPQQRPTSIADDVAENWAKSKSEVVSPEVIETYSRDGVTRTNSQGELTIVDAAKQSGRRIEAIWKLDPASNWCEECYRLDGTTRDVWGKVAPNGPQLHPNCACSLEYIEVDEHGKPVDYTPYRDRS